MGDDRGVTHGELARTAGVSVTTVKSYRSKFPGCFPVRHSGKPLRFAPEALEACAAIRQGFLDGLSVEELRERLRLRFPWSYRHARKASPDMSPDLQKTVQDLAQALVRMTQAHTATEKRLDRMEEALRSLAQPEHPPSREEIKSLQLELKELRSSIKTSGKDAASKIVRIRTKAGDIESYAINKLATEKAQAEAHPEGAAPPDTTLDMPLTALSPKGEYLGVTSGGRHLTLRSFLSLASKKLGPGATTRWSGDAENRHLTIDADHTYTLDIQTTTTPRGNTVALARNLTIDGAPQDGTTTVHLLRTFKDEIKD